MWKDEKWKATLRRLVSKSTSICLWQEITGLYKSTIKVILIFRSWEIGLKRFYFIIFLTWNPEFLHKYLIQILNTNKILQYYKKVLKSSALKKKITNQYKRTIKGYKNNQQQFEKYQKKNWSSTVKNRNVATKIIILFEWNKSKENSLKEWRINMMSMKTTHDSNVHYKLLC